MDTYVTLLEEAILQYVGLPVLERLKTDPVNALKLNRQPIDATILFTDIRSFSGLLEKFPIDILLDDLNVYFGRMSEIILRHHGFVDSLNGDAICAIFGISNSNHADDACSAAIECLESLSEFNIGRDMRFKFEMGIGINSGKVLLGNIGSKHKLQFTASGHMVNLASRMEGLTKKYQCNVVMTELTKKLLTIDLRTKELDRVSVTGLQGQLILYSLQP
jgi:adenylate cyclase